MFNINRFVFGISLVALAGCNVAVDVQSDSYADSTTIKGFTTPANADYTSKPYYDFSWPAYELAGAPQKISKVSVSDASALYHLSIYKNANCSGSAEFTVDQDPNTYRLTDLSNENEPITLGVQVRFTDGTLGPITCSAPIEHDTTPPTLTLTNSATSPLRNASLTLSGTCADNRKIADSGIRLCIKANGSCTASDYTIAPTCSSGTYSHAWTPAEGFYDVRAYMIDHAENSSLTHSLGLVIVDRSNPTNAVFTAPTVPTTIGTNSYTFNWVASDVGLAGLSTTQPYSWSLYNSASCTGAAVTSGTTLSAQTTVNSLTDGQLYTLSVIARDEAGNTSTAVCSSPISVAMAAPTLALTDPTNSIVVNRPTFAKTATVSVNITTDPAAAGWCLSETQTTAPTPSTCNGGAWVSTRPTAYTLSGGDGVKTVYLWIKDSLGNMIALGTTDNITLDTTSPSVGFSAPANNSSHNASVLITGTCESGFPVEFSGTGASAPSTATCASGSFSHTVTFSAGQGTKDITISQTDDASNSTSVNRSYINDTIAPTITIAAPAALSEVQSTLTLSGVCETGLPVDITGDIPAPTTATCSASAYSVVLTLSAGDGTKTITAAQTDAAGNTSSDQRQFVRDNVAPTLTQTTLTSPHHTNTNSVTFGGACEAGYTVTAKLGATLENTTTCTAGTWSYTVATQTTDATRTYNFEQSDAAGNLSTVSAQWVRDTVAPTLTIAAPSTLLTMGNTVSFTGTCEASLPDPIAVTNADTSTTACSAGSWSYSVAAQTTDGARSYSFSLTDRAGNTSTVSGMWTRTTTAPALALSDSTNSIPANQESHAKTTSVSSAITSDTAAVAWCLSETQTTLPTAGACTGTGWLGARPTTFTLSGSQGSKTVYLWIKDELNFVYGTAATDTISLDTINPTPLTIATPAASSSHNATITLTGTCETGLTTVFAGTGISGGPINQVCSGGTYSQALTFTAGQGAKAITVTQTDSASNSTQTTLSVINDTIAPTLTITSPAVNTNTTGAITLAGACETSINIVYSGDINAQAPVACSGSAYSQGLTLSGADGTKTVTVTQTDAAGNVTTQSRTFIKDTVAPVITQTLLSTPHSTNTNTVTYGGSCESGYSVIIKRGGTTENSVGCVASNWSYAVNTQTSDGTYNYTFEQTDAAGNTASAAAQWIRDTVDPTLTITTASYTTFGNNVTFSGTCEFGIGATINITGPGSATTTCNMGGIWSYTVATQTTNATRNYTFSYTDAALNTTSRVGTWIRNVVAPTLTLTDTTNTIPANQSTHAKTTSISVNVSAVSGAVGWCLSETQSTTPTAATCNGSSWVASAPTSMTLSTPDGSKSVYVWLKDSLNTVLSLGHSRSMVLDRVAPTVAFSTPAVNSVHSGTLTVTGTCETGISVDIGGAGIQTPVSATCSAGTFSQAITLSAAQGSKTISITQTDSASNSTSATRTFINDTVAPNLTIATPAANTSAQSSVTLTGVCETGLNIQFAGDLLSTLNVACSGGTYSQSVFFSAGDGTKTVTVTQVDSAGNTTAPSRNFIRDNVVPAITQTTLAFPYYSNTNSVTFGGACETGLTVTIRLGAGVEGTTSCTAGTWSYAVATKSSDSTYNYTFEQTDLAGNLGTASGRWIRDTVQPALAITSSASQVTASNTVTFSGTCESGLPNPIAVTGTDSTTTACSSGSWSYTVATRTTDATRTYNFTLTDQAGNSRTVVGTWERNTNVPNLLITSSTRVVNGTNTGSFSGNCEAGLNIEVRLGGVLENTIACAAGTFTYTTATQTTDASRSYQLRQTNALLLSTNVNGTWIRDTTAPVFTANQMRINENAVETNIARVDIDLQAIDALTNVTHFCVKLESSQPLANDSCFTAVDAPSVGLTPGLTLTLNNFKYNLPIVPDVYTVYTWAKDEVGNVSALTSAGAGTALRDRDSINFVVYNPPAVLKVLVGSTNYPADPPSTLDLTVGAGQPLYIKWKATDDKVLGATPMTVSFTTDDVTFTQIATGLVNGQNGSCTVNHGSTTADDDATGCYYWSSVPVGGFVRIRVVAQDSDGLTGGLNSVPLNVASNVRFLAGNTDPGTNLSAQAATFLSTDLDSASATDPQSLVVTRDGTVYFKDSLRGILKIDPSDGVQRVFIPTTGSSTGDGGPATSATLRLAYKIALDHNFPQQRLWIFDYNRIRRVDLDTGIITTVIGGSGTDNSDTVANALNVRVDYPSSGGTGWKRFNPFHALPNGDFYYQANNDGTYDAQYNSTYRIRHYVAATGEVKSFKAISITSTSQHTTGNFMDCHHRGFGMAYNRNTSAITARLLTVRLYPNWSGGECATYGDQNAIVSVDASGVGAASGSHPPRLHHWMERFTYHTGLDGNLYSFSKFSPSGIWKFIPGSPGTWTQILGDASGLPGKCDDLTAALSCRTIIHDLFVQEDGTVYFLDSGRIRTITPSLNVLTLMGQDIISASSGSPLAARLGTDLREFHLRNDGGVTFSIIGDHSFYEFMPDGQIYRVAGNGSMGGPTLGATATATPLNMEHPHNTGDDFAMDPATGDIYHSTGAYWGVRKLTRTSSAIGTTGVWSNFIGDGTYHWADPSANGQSSISFSLSCAGFGYDPGTYMDPNCWIYPQAKSFVNNKLFVHLTEYTRVIATNAEWPRNKMIKLYDATSKVQSHLVGVVGPGTVAYDGYCADGVLLSTCEFLASDRYRILTPHYDSVGGKYITARADWGKVFMLAPGGTMLSYNTSHAMRSFAYRRDGGTEYIYYCSNSTGQIRRRNLNTSVEVALPWPVTSIQCQYGTMAWSSSRNSVIFVYSQNNMMGFAEYLDTTP